MVILTFDCKKPRATLFAKENGQRSLIFQDTYLELNDAVFTEDVVAFVEKCGLICLWLIAHL